MPVRHLDGAHMTRALAAGVQRVIANQEALNRINVFPVADGDTGTNLALTLGAMRDALGRDDLPLAELMNRIADALLDGARGNSGAIMAQFFQGLADAAAELARFTAGSFSRAVSLGADYARQALAEPREGTIITVIGAFAEDLSRRVRHEEQRDLRVLMERGLATSRKALEATRHQLDALRRAGVVDAGAKGFVALLEGMVEYLRDGRTVEPPDLAALPEVDAAAVPPSADEDAEYRYCTECIVTGERIDRRKLRERLSALGGSLVLAGTRRKAKIHIHVDDPEAVFALGREFGDVSSTKADDMLRQDSTRQRAGNGVAVITDSAADIVEDRLEKLDIHIVPLRIQFGERGYLDKVSLTADEFFRELANNPAHPKTSQPAPGDFRRQFQFLASHFPHVIAVSLTGTVSGTLTAARAAAERVEAEGEVHVVDSRNASLGQGLIAVHAAECAAAGMEASAILEELERTATGTRTFGLVADLDYAVRGGRVPPSKKLIADFLRINPVLRSHSDGRITATGVILGRGNRVPKFARYIAKRTEPGRNYRIAVGHARCPDDAERLHALLCERLDRVADSYITDIGATIGAHGGPGTLVAAVQERD